MGHPLAFATFLQHIGEPTERLFNSHGLPALCDDANAFVPLRSAWGFFDACARIVDPMVGWHVGRYVGDQNLGRGLLRELEHSPTLYQALQLFVRLVSAEASHLQLGIIERRDDILFYTHYSDMKEVAGYTSSQGYQLEIFVDLVRHYVGKHWAPHEIGIEYPTVPSVVEERFPDARILTSQRMGYIAIPRSCLHTPPPGADPGAGEGGTLAITREFGYADTLRELLKPHLAQGYPTARLAAALMDTSLRTLARRLSESGVGYRTLIDELRFDSARELLRTSGARISDVADAVGFEDPTHFTRMFRRVGGLTPREFRNANQ
jgi:AraC-like DNA-binding protein